MDVWAYDIEVFRNCFTAAFINVKDYCQKCEGIEKLPYVEQLRVYDSVERKLFVVYNDRNDIAKLISFMNQPQYIVGFNSSRYDDTIIKYIMMKLYYVTSSDSLTKKIYDFSQELIQSQNDRNSFNWRVNNARKLTVQFKGIDLMSAFGLNKVFKSLKQTAINIKWHSLIDYKMPAPKAEELGLYEHYENPYELEDWHRYVMPNHMDGIVHYNFNDSLVTAEIFRKKIQDIVLRMNISAKYGIDVISSSESDIADKMFAKLYCDRSGLTADEFSQGCTPRDKVIVNECIPDTIEFKTNEMNTFLNELRKTVIVNTKGDMNFDIKFDGTNYTFATGGLHSKDTPGVLVSDDKYDYTDGDAAAYYPWNVLHHGIHPEHLDKDMFLGTVKGTVLDRADAKPSGKNPDKVVDKTLKVVINSGIFG